MSQLSMKQAHCLPFTHAWVRSFAGSLVSIISLFTGACSNSEPGPACKVATSGIADAPITGKSLLDKTLAFTFDHAPSAFTAEIADLLTSRQINAAFFVVGKQLE